MPSWSALPLWAKIILVPVIIVASIQIIFIVFSAVVAILGLAQTAVAAVTD